MPRYLWHRTISITLTLLLSYGAAWVQRAYPTWRVMLPYTTVWVVACAYMVWAWIIKKGDT